MSSNFFSSFKKFDKKIKQEGDKEEVQGEVQPLIIKKSENVNFAHSIYGIVTKGPKKGYEIEVRYYLPEKFEVEIGVNEDIVSNRQLNKGDVVDNCVILAQIAVDKYLGYCNKIVFFQRDDLIRGEGDKVIITSGPLKDKSGILKSIHAAKVGVVFTDNSPMTLDASDIFYKDLLLHNGRYFNVESVELDGKAYNIIGKELNGMPVLKTISLDDVEKMMPGFKLHSSIKEYKQLHKDDEDIFAYSDVTSEISSEISDSELGSESGSDSSELFEKEYMEDSEYPEETEEPEYKSSYKDIERTSVMPTVGVNKLHVDLVKRVLKFVNVNEDSVNVYGIVGDVDNALVYFNTKIKGSQKNFNIYKSMIDVQIIIACVVGYSLAKMRIFNYKDMRGYMKELFNAGFFNNKYDNSVFAELYEDNIFPCIGLTFTKDMFEKLMMLVSCFDNILREVLQVKVNFDQTDINIEPIVRREKKFDKRSFLLPSDFASKELDTDKKFVWDYRGKSMSPSVYKNIDATLLKLRSDVLDFLKLRFSNFVSLMRDCDEDTKCENDLIMKYIDIVNKQFLDGSGKSKAISDKDYDMIKRYTDMSKFMDVRGKASEEVKLEDVLSKLDISDSKGETDDLENILSKLKISDKGKGKGKVVELNILDSNDIIKWLSSRFGYKIEEFCKDSVCKDKEISDKLKLVLSKYKKKLSDSEIKKIDEFILKTDQVRKFPKIILKLKRPSNY